MTESLVGIIVPNAVTATRESTIEQSPIQNIFCKCPENFLRDILQHQEFFLYYGKIFPTKNTPTRYSLMKNVLKISNLNITSIAPRNNKIKRRELRVRQNIVKGHSKQAFCVLIIITCNYLIMVVFSSEFFLLIVVTACQIQRDLNT